MTAVATPPKKKSKKTKADKFDKLIGPTDANEDAKAREKLISARVALMLRQPFFGNLAMHLKLVNGDEWLATAATDGRTFYYNARFVNMLQKGEVEFLVGHEVLHVVYDHMGRRGDRDMQLWNIADDYCVNADLKKHKVGTFITTVPCLYEAKYDGWSAEQVYDDLMENADKMSLDDLIDKLLDEHMDGEGEDGEGDGDESGQGKGRGKRPEPLTAEEREKLRQEMKQNVINAMKSCEAGQVPGNIKRMVEDLINPKMPWRELLNTNLISTFKTDYSFMRPNRKGWHMSAIMPGMTPGQEVNVVVAVDTSGSISARDIKIFLSEIHGIMEAFDSYNIHVFSFDTQSYNPQNFTSDNLADIAEYEPEGGGGTDFDAIFNYLKEEGMEPERLVVFTDGYPFGSWGDENYCDTTWIIHGDPNPNPPFGQWAVYDDHKS